MADEKHFVDKHRIKLIEKVSNIPAILDELLRENVIQQETYDKIRALPTSQDKIRELFSGPLEASGVQGKEMFYKILNKHESYLINDLKTTEVPVEPMMAKKLLFETLNDLSSEELHTFKSLFESEKGFPLSPRSLQDTVELMVETYSHECVELTKKVLKTMNRTDLVQRLSDISSGTKEKQQPSLIQRVETMTSVIELLLETLKELRHRELQKFKKVLVNQTDFHRYFSDTPSMQRGSTDRQAVVFLLVEIYGQQSVEKTKEVLKNMERTDLVQKLSHSSSAPKKKHSVDEYLSALIHKVATMSAVKELLLETLRGLSSEELEKFKWLLQLTFFQRRVPKYSSRQLQWTDTADKLVDVMLEIYGQQAVEMTREVLMEMKRTDLVQMLSETISGTKAAGSSAEELGVSTTEKEKDFVDEHCPALIPKVETMASVIELLLETLKELRDGELQKFMMLLVSQTDFRRHFSVPLWMLLESTDKQSIVFSVVLICGQQSVEKTKEVLMEMKRTDLVQKLSDSSSAPKKKHSDEHRPALIQRVATKAAVKQLLLETLNDLNNEELWEFKQSLKWISFQKNLPDISWMLSDPEYRAEIVDLMLEIYGQQSVEMIRDVFMKMNRTDLVQRLSKPSSGLKEKHSVDEHGPALSKRAAAMAAMKQVLLETLKDLSNKQLRKFKWLLQFTLFQKSLPLISWSLLDWEDTGKLVDRMLKTCGQQSVEVTREVLMDMNRRDLLRRLSETMEEVGRKRSIESQVTVMEGPGLPSSVISSGLKRRHCRGTGLGFSVVGHPSVPQPRVCFHGINDCSLHDWTKLEPEVNSPDADEAPTYNLHSEAGNFECSVSGLRWVCKEKVSFKYQFCSWEGIMERMESLQYMPAGPLMDITVIAGKLDEAYLPHWICIDDNPKILDKFAVLHIGDCGDVVEKVSEVTSSHVKLSEPFFSPRAALMKMGLPVKIGCQVLIYYISKSSFLRLHVYLIPHDHGLQQTVDKKKEKQGYKRIEKPRPDKYLKMQQGFKLAATINMAKILPEKITLRYDSQDPNFYEVNIENPDTNFQLTLSPFNNKKGEPQCEPVWICEIQKVDYQNSADSQAATPSAGATGVNTGADGKHFVDKHRIKLIERVSNIAIILDELLYKDVIQQETYNKIRVLPTSQEKMRELYSGPLNAAGDCKDIFYKIIEEKERYLVDELKKKE
ncbi:uncharacterized protein LOC120562342 isoform X2 [Perca fluviatilis]|uniref:uncharacterized protein LOC120562342 isoform X2 n=1 Tax=Perca fluviatilis TaxID=8168 RepID=UPI0019639B1E|nr:uncharacterized protein LOC120562342 isoform X2 [Perca fluviatilis]